MRRILYTAYTYIDCTILMTLLLLIAVLAATSCMQRETVVVLTFLQLLNNGKW